MENASKALLMAGGILISILVISLLVGLFQSTGRLNQSYNKEIETSEVQKFNSNFTKYLTQKISIYDVITICNFAENNNIHKLSSVQNKKNIDDISSNLDTKYKLIILGFDEEGYVDKIMFTS